MDPSLLAAGGFSLVAVAIFLATRHQAKKEAEARNVLHDDASSDDFGDADGDHQESDGDYDDDDEELREEDEDEDLIDAAAAIAAGGILPLRAETPAANGDLSRWFERITAVTPLSPTAAVLAQRGILQDIQVPRNLPVPEASTFVAIGVFEHVSDGDSGKSSAPDYTARSSGKVRIRAVFGSHEVAHDGSQLPVRIHEPDAWEMGQGKAGKLGEEFAVHLLQNKEVILVGYVPDDHGRMLCDVYLLVNLPGIQNAVPICYARAAIRTGRAIVYRGTKRPEGNPELAPLEARAKAEKQGVWGLEGEYMLPHEWRQQKRGESSAQQARRQIKRGRNSHLPLRSHG